MHRLGLRLCLCLLWLALVAKAGRSEVGGLGGEVHVCVQYRGCVEGGGLRTGLGGGVGWGGRKYAEGRCICGLGGRQKEGVCTVVPGSHACTINTHRPRHNHNRQLNTQIH